ncbi:MAG: hypothetical protein QXG98_02410 [Candidatus Micrarchaeia archaeon]
MQREELFEKARLGVREAFIQRDRILIHTISAIDELAKTNNLLYERLAEWFKIYFPEMRADEPEKYCALVEIVDKERFDVGRVAQIVGEAKARELEAKARMSLGIDLQNKDLEEIRLFASRLRAHYELRRQLEGYLESLAREVCPNLTHLLGAPLAAKLIAQAGGLSRLATLPASTVQILGAEKALFKHLRAKTKPPKHGLLFQHPLISTAPKKQRGKIARALAAKVAIAAKADAFTKHFIAEKLKVEFESRVKAIRGGG